MFNLGIDCFVGERVTHHIPIIENLGTSLTTVVDLKPLMSCISYDLLTDGSELIVSVVSKEEVEFQGIHLEEGIRRFTVYSAEECIPEYKHLRLRQSLSKQKDVDR